MDGHIFKITGVSREDLLELFPQSKKKIERLSDADMEYLAQKMADRYVACCFWNHLQTLGEEILKK